MRTAFCFDLDGTVTKDEILPILAKQVDLYDEIQALTQATINGFIPFDRSFKLRTRLLSDIPISRVRESIAGVTLFERTSGFIKSHSDSCFLITGNLDVWISELVKKLGVYAYSSRALLDDKVDHLKGCYIRYQLQVHISNQIHACIRFS